MADIQSLLRQLLSAVYGKDVRQAIHDAIHQCYADGKAGSIDLVARENIDLANKRIDNLAKLEEGSTTGDAELQDIRVGADRKIYDSAGEAVRGQVSAKVDKPVEDGIEGQVLARDAEGNIVWKDAMNELEDGIVTPVKTSFFNGFKEDGFLFNIKDINTQYEYISGKSSEYGYIYMGFYLTDYIPYDKDFLFIRNEYDTSWITGLRIIILFYDSEKNYIGSTGNGLTSYKITNMDGYCFEGMKRPEGGAYFRILSDTTSQAYEYFPYLSFYESMPQKKNIVGLDDEVGKNLIKRQNISTFSHNNMADDLYFMLFNTNDFVKAIMPFPVSDSHLYSSVFEVEYNKPYYFRTQTVGTDMNYAYKSLHAYFLCYDESGNILAYSQTSFGTDEYTKKELVYAKDGAGNLVITKITVINEKVKYVRFVSNRNLYNSLPQDIIISFKEMSPDADADDYMFIDSDLLVDYTEKKISDGLATHDSYYTYQRLGILTPLPSDNQYICWAQECMQYDAAKDWFACVMRASPAHEHTTNGTHFCTLDAKTLKSSSISKIVAGDFELAWSCGFAILNDGTYIIIGLSNEDRETPRLLKSTDYGSTWTNEGVVTVDDGAASAKFFSIKLLKSGRLLGVYDDTVNETSATRTIISYSDDNGLTWNSITVSETVGVVEQTFLELDNGTIIAYGRRNNYTWTNKSYLSYSMDNGLTWTEPVASAHIEQGPSDATAFVNYYGNVEVFITHRNNGTPNGYLYHYVATQEDALNDIYTLRSVWMANGQSYSDFTAPCVKCDSRGNALLVYSDSVKGVGQVPTQWNFIYGGINGNDVRCCDGQPSDIMPYSGAKVEKLIAELRELITN